jgi:hypothetical protein
VTQERFHNRLRLLVTLWILLWMGLAAPCAMAGPMAGPAGEGDHLAAGGSPDGDGAPAALLCLHDCNQLALGQDLQPLPSPDFGLARAGSAAAEPGAIESAGPTPEAAAPYPRRATYLLNATFLI